MASGKKSARKWPPFFPLGGHQKDIEAPPVVEAIHHLAEAVSTCLLLGSTAVGLILHRRTRKLQTRKKSAAADSKPENVGNWKKGSNEKEREPEREIAAEIETVDAKEKERETVTETQNASVTVTAS